MKYFIEFSQFSAEDEAAVRMLTALRAQMSRRERDTPHWVEWKEDGSNASFYPDVTLISAAHLDWRQLKCVVDACAAGTIVLTGRHDSVLSLPLVPDVKALSDLLQYLPRPSPWAIAMPEKKLHHLQNYRATWADTTPVSLTSVRA